jgi:hypothetical protein
MTNLRDQAREAARADTYWDSRGMSNTGHHRMAGSDISSDHWEPLTRDLFNIVRHMIVTPDEEWTDEDDERLDEVFNRAMEALR